MLTDFDQNTIANMTAALESVCKKIPPDRDTHELRKQIGDAMIVAATSGRRSFIELQNVGLQALNKVLSSSRSGWLSRFFW
jgi:hypothetical protein